MTPAAPRAAPASAAESAEAFSRYRLQPYTKRTPNKAVGIWLKYDAPLSRKKGQSDKSAAPISAGKGPAIASARPLNTNSSNSANAGGATKLGNFKLVNVAKIRGHPGKYWATHLPSLSAIQ